MNRPTSFRPRTTSQRALGRREICALELSELLANDRVDMMRAQVRHVHPAQGQWRQKMSWRDARKARKAGTAENQSVFQADLAQVRLESVSPVHEVCSGWAVEVSCGVGGRTSQPRLCQFPVRPKSTPFRSVGRRLALDISICQWNRNSPLGMRYPGRFCRTTRPSISTDAEPTCARPPPRARPYTSSAVPWPDAPAKIPPLLLPLTVQVM